MAIFLGSSNFSGSNGSHFAANVYLDSYTQDKTNNTTGYKLHLYAGSVDGWTGYGVAINGYLQGVATGSTTSFPARTQVDLGTYSGILQHDTNGVGTLNVSAYVDASAWSGVGTASINTKYSFPTIPRKANISGQTTADIESTYTININRLVDNYNYTLRYSITDDDNVVHTDTIATGINQDSYEWTIPEIFYQYWTKPDIKYFKIYCDTYNGNALIGTTELQVQLMVLSKTKPNITEYTFTDINTETVALTGNNSVMVKGYSIGRLFMTAELDYYAKVNKVYSIPEYVEISYNVEKGETNKKQIITVDNTYTDFDSLHGYRIDDTRGLQGRLVARTNKMANKPASVKQIIYTTIDYVPLTLNMSAKRPQATTGEVTVEFSGNYFNSSFGAVTNTLELSWKYRQKGVETWTDGGTFTKDTDYKITGNTFNSKGAISLGNIFDYRNIYEIAIHYKDKLVNTYTSKTVTRGLPIFWWNKDGVYDGNNKKFLVEGDVKTPVVNDTYSTSTTDTYSCNYINSHNLKSTILHEITPINSTNYDDGWGGSYYYKTGSRVYLHVAVALTTKQQTNITTLPIGYRPRTKIVNTCSGGNLGVFGTLQVNPDGKVYCYSNGIHLFGEIIFDIFED